MREVKVNPVGEFTIHSDGSESSVKECPSPADFPPPFVEDGNLPAPVDKPQPKVVGEPPKSVESVGGASLAAALAIARDRCLPAEKDAYHSYHNYWYASSDSVLKSGNAALQGSGVSLIPINHVLKIVGTGNTAHYELERNWLLVHSSGESLALKTPWPVLPERGKPLNVSIKIAMKESMAMLVQGLLQIPGGEIAEPQSEEQPPPEQPPPEQPTETPSAHAEVPPITEVQLADLDRLVTFCVKNNLLTAPQWFDGLKRGYGVEEPRQLTTEQAARIIDNLRRKYSEAMPQPATEEKVDGQSRD
jgi:hypothetical protein